MILRTNLLAFHCLGTEQLVSLDSMARKFHSQHRQSAWRHYLNISDIDLRGVRRIGPTGSALNARVSRCAPLCATKHHEKYVNQLLLHLRI
jgi:hypothetical protein